ncbi:MurR/RpiR family transcriptional regulator [Stenotrophomonas maltophilia]|jgi:DNA-binding MurR/RpiR family transcriptional regulator|uniref:Transcriptional regulator n=1 Tax=Stenotrophomonas maltophilia TaxID=40324 RepID=A0AAP7L043_STEMA|nr:MULTISPECIES: MurR/RpiR family transcriptional regulator [Stenotrophomonas]MBA0221819.1 MurR/RpiR family transcriptional regulator [Stenotrophomonas maltophilia]MBE5271425.1 MurR/RpiR family transcriptional regulator [Stenotrophomonas sp. B2]MBH1666608.1 MurR/RpiR family transcriptional regulator [Stenotrophomonas maltophilia]MBH1836125.1 MurR/RpiR family transcriptional regulator [Stenotrophomonas maltophilia]MCO7400047.1 MurR/RpiR family transcriptional regulator [Stenotrophomonas maltoph
MPPLVKIRSERGQMSAIERRIADFILDNAHLLRDYSSQQLASALGISQSSVVKFSQKLGFKGYPDLKYSIGQDVARAGHDPQARPPSPSADDYADIAGRLRLSRAAAEEETSLANAQADVEAIVRLLDRAPKVFVYGLGDDGLYAREFAMRLSLLGMLTVHHADPILMMANLSAARAGDAMLVFSEFGKLPQLFQLSRQFQDVGGKVVSITRHTANPLRAHADQSLVVCAHDPAPHVAQLLYRASLQSLLDFVFVLLCHANPDRHRQLGVNLERIEHLIDA